MPVKAHRWSEPWVGWALTVGVIAVAALPRMVGILRSYDVTGDEVDYIDLSRSAMQGHFPPEFQHVAFTLHPPLFYFMTALWYAALGTGGTYYHLVAEARAFNVVLAAASAGLMYAVTSRVATRVCGLVAALLFAFGPYVLRLNGRAMLETSTVMWVLAGTLVVLSLLSGRSRRPWTSAIVGGILLGLGIVTNDIAVVLVVIPLGVALWRDWGPHRLMTVTALVGSLVPYGIYLGALFVTGHFGDFTTQGRQGVLRMLGVEQSTGFNSPGAPSLVHTMISQLSTFGVTYLLCGAGVIAALYLLRRDDRPGVRYLATVTLAGTATLIYAVLLGTLEEQFFYYLYVPALAAVPVATQLWLSRREQVDHKGASVRAVAALALLGAFVGYSAAVAFQIRSIPDNGQQRLAAWFQQRAGPGGSTPKTGIVVCDTEATVLLLNRSGIPSVLASTPAVAAADHAQYFTELSSVEKGYSHLSASQLDFFTSHATPVFSLTERTYGTVTVWRTTDPTAW